MQLKMPRKGKQLKHLKRVWVGQMDKARRRRAEERLLELSQQRKGDNPCHPGCEVIFCLQYCYECSEQDIYVF